MLLPLRSITSSLVPTLSQKSLYIKKAAYIRKVRYNSTPLKIQHTTVSSSENKTHTHFNTVQFPHAL